MSMAFVVMLAFGIGCALVLLGAIFMVHWGQWHFMATETHPMGGMNFQVVLLLMAVYFLVRGNDTY